MNRVPNQLHATLYMENKMSIGYEGRTEIPECENCEYLKEALRDALQNFYYIHRHSKDAHTDSYKFMNEIEQILKGKVND